MGPLTVSMTLLHIWDCLAPCCTIQCLVMRFMVLEGGGWFMTPSHVRWQAGFGLEIFVHAD